MLELISRTFPTAQRSQTGRQESCELGSALTIQGHSVADAQLFDIEKPLNVGDRLAKRVSAEAYEDNLAAENVELGS